MRRVITGLDENGRSTVLHDGPAPVVFAVSDKSQLTKVEDPTADLAPTDRTALVHELWRLNDQPSASGIDPTTALTQPGFDPATAHTQWILTEMGPGSYTPMHSTPSVDYAVVVAGDVVLGLENGSVHLYAGDTMLVNAVKHTWEAGANGAVLATVLVGLRDDERGAATGTDFPTD
jgi:quercetin dioxygenase-like cupin family protein